LDIGEFMSIDNGGSAFPSHGSMGEVVQEGMALRDYFAAKAMAKILPDASVLQKGDGFRANVDAISVLSYAIADAMLAAREVQS
jgi:hypothetical protein